ncbi:FxsA family protein [Clostridiaceae bacterium M8S5]|nr:FxsA family protein [Clostridiaceae bacterium M8S5]
MIGKLILLFIGVPIVELFILLKLASITSTLTTIFIIITTGMVGAYLAKKEGRSILRNIRFELNNGHMPANNLIDGLCVLIGGAFLITPGIITDLVGFTLVLPFTRILYREYIKAKFTNMLNRGTINIWRS